MMRLFQEFDIAGVGTRLPGIIDDPEFERYVRLNALPNKVGGDEVCPAYEYGEGWCNCVVCIGIVPQPAAVQAVEALASLADPEPAQGIKLDTGKPAFDLIEPFFLEDIARVLTKGAQKYDVDNWKRGMSFGKAFAGVLRHLFAVARGEWLDPETGLSHLAHATCGIMFLHYFKRTDGFKPDDRFPK